MFRKNKLRENHKIPQRKSSYLIAKNTFIFLINHLLSFSNHVLIYAMRCQYM